ncbi:taurine transporter subunit, partial [Azospirillum sp. 11R-A]
MTDIARPGSSASDPADRPKIVRLHPFGLDGARTGPISLATALLLLAAWFLVTHYRLVPPLFLPTPQEVATQFLAIFEDGYAGATLWEHVSASLFRIFSAAVIAASLGIPLGLAMGLNRWAKGVFDTPI